MKSRATACLFVALVSTSFSANAGSESVWVDLPASEYAFKNMPPCEGDLRDQAHKLMRDEKFQGAVTSANAIAGAVVGVIGNADKLSREHGGDISKLIRKSLGGSKSTCATVVFAFPDGAIPRYFTVSNRGGVARQQYWFKPQYPSIVDRQDWSGWRDITLSKIDDRYWLEATAVNWQARARIPTGRLTKSCY